jgi:hypothetical protein
MSKEGGGGGIGFVGLLTVLFIGLKLTGHIDWGWWWVLSPLWITALVVVALFAFFVALAILAEAVKRRRNKKEAVAWRKSGK